MALILIVDDRAINREFLTTLLGYSKHRLLEAANGMEALDAIKEVHPDLIITDILMPTMSGYELVKKLHADPHLAKIPVIFYTATYRLEEAQSLAKSCGVQYVLTKPSEPQVIIDLVNKILGETVAHSIVEEKKPQKKMIEPIQLGEGLFNYLADMESIKETFNTLIKQTEALALSRENLIEIADKFSQSLNQLRKMGSRLVTLIEFNLDIVGEHDPRKLLKLFSEGARKIIGTKCLVVGVLENSDGKFNNYAVTFSVDSSSLIKPNLSKIDHDAIEQILTKRDILKMDKPNVLGVPIITASHLYGFIYCMDKVDNTEFNQVDMQIASTLATEISVLYENIELYNVIQRHAANLEIEKTKRSEIQQKLTISESLFRQFAENIDEVFWRYDPKAEKIVYVSPAYEKIWKRTVEEIYEYPEAWLESVVPEDRTRVKEVFASIYKGETSSVSVEYKIMQPNAEIRNILDRATLLKEESSRELIGVIGIATDITELKKVEYDLSLSLKEKEALLKEIYHRVKNNLQVVSSLLSLQSRSIVDPDAKKMMIESASRVKAMALVHEMFYRSGNLAKIEIEKYVSNLSKNLLEIYHVNPALVKLDVDIDTISLNLEEAIPCGLIINELLSNAFKHAFPAGKSGVVTIAIKKRNKNVILTVSDNGVGLPANMDVGNTATLGMQLIYSLAKQLEGDINLDRTKGTNFTFIFALKERGERNE
jgi:PAS domain S-box-containing protein